MMGRPNTATVDLPITDRLPANWESAVEPARSFLVACYDDPAETVLWGGWVSSLTYGSDPHIGLTLTDLNGYLEGTRRVGNWRIVQEEQTSILRRLGGDIVAGMFNGEIVEIPSGVLRDRNYRDDTDKTRLSAMQQLMSVVGGPEWTFDFKWDNGALMVLPTFAQMVGRRVPSGQARPVLSDVEWSKTVDYSSGKGATIVTAVATREADERLQITRQDDGLLDANYMVLEHRWSPDTGSVDEDILTSYVDRKLADISRGTQTYSVSVNVADSDILFNRDMSIGDDISIDLRQPDLLSVEESIDGRLIGFVAEPDPESGEIVTIEPVLYKDTEDEG